MRTGDRAEHLNQDGENSACCNRIAEKRDRYVSGRQGVSHDARADNGGEQESSSEEFCSETPREIVFWHV